MKKQTLILIFLSCYTLLSAQVISYPYSESFEDPDPLYFTWDNLVTDDGNNCGPWEYNHQTGTPTGGTGPAMAQDGASFIYLEADNCSSLSVVYTTGPIFDLTGLKLPTWTFYYHRDGNNVGDLNLEISVNTGTWSNLITYTQNSQSWQFESIDLSSYIDQQVQFRFAGEDRAGSKRGDIAIDNITLYDAGLINGNGDVTYVYDAAGNRVQRLYTVSSMAQSEQQMIASSRSAADGKQVEFIKEEWFNVYPNPATHFINIEQLESSGSVTVHLLDIKGSELYVGHMDNGHTQIDMSSYQSGTYVLWLQAGDQVVTKKIMKH